MGLLCCLAGCATEVARYPSDFQPTASNKTTAELKTKLNVVFDNGYERSVPAGTQFDLVGKIEQGEVFKPKSTVFTVEGKHMHEAYIVVQKQKLVGFYLPVEKAFSPLSRPINIPF